MCAAVEPQHFIQPVHNPLSLMGFLDMELNFFSMPETQLFLLSICRLRSILLKDFKEACHRVRASVSKQTLKHFEVS